MGKIVFKILKVFLLLGGAVGMVWGVFALVDNIKDGNTATKEQLEKIITVQEAEKIKTDSLSINMQRLNKNMGHLTKEQKSLRQSYVRYLSNDDALTKDDFLEYMQGIELDIKKNGQRD